MPFWSSSNKEDKHLSSTPATPGIASWAFQSLFSNTTPLTKYNELNRRQKEQHQDQQNQYQIHDTLYIDGKEPLKNGSGDHDNLHIPSSSFSPQNDGKIPFSHMQRNEDSKGRKLFGNEEDDYMNTPYQDQTHLPSEDEGYVTDTFHNRRIKRLQALKRSTNSHSSSSSSSDRNGYRLNVGKYTSNVTPNTKRFYDDKELLLNDTPVDYKAQNGGRTPGYSDSDLTSSTIPTNYPGKFPSVVTSNKIQQDDTLSSNRKKGFSYNGNKIKSNISRPEISESEKQGILSILDTNNSSLEKMINEFSKLELLPKKLQQSQEINFQLESQNKKLQQLCDKINRDFDDQSELLTKTKGHLEGLYEKYSTMKTEFNNMKLRFDELGEKYLSLKEEAKNKETFKENLKIETQSLKNQAKEIETLKKSESENAKLIESLKRELSLSNSKIVKLSEEIKEKEKYNLSVTSKLEEVTYWNNVLKAEVKELEGNPKEEKVKQESIHSYDNGHKKPRMSMRNSQSWESSLDYDDNGQVVESPFFTKESKQNISHLKSNSFTSLNSTLSNHDSIKENKENINNHTSKTYQTPLSSHKQKQSYPYNAPNINLINQPTERKEYLDQTAHVLQLQDYDLKNRVQDTAVLSHDDTYMLLNKSRNEIAGVANDYAGSYDLLKGFRY